MALSCARATESVFQRCVDGYSGGRQSSMQDKVLHSASGESGLSSAIPFARTM